MFVFPAFDENYKTRKRTFICCQKCRDKRVKCEIISTNFETVGCSNCRKNSWKCDLINNKNSVDQNSTLKDPIPRMTEVENSREQRLQDKFSSHKLDSIDMKNITPQYLREKFNFCITKRGQQLLYQYVFHVHPKAILSNQTEDNSLWHESGVYVEDDKLNPDISNLNSVKNYNRKSGTDPAYYIKSSKIYKFLLSIDAFSLATPEYPFTEHEIERLIDIYFFKINSLFPIINEERFREDFESKELQTIIIYVIVLVILRDKLAEPILKEVFARVYHERGVLYTDSDFRKLLVQFMTDLEHKVRQITLILPQLGDTDKLSKLIVLLLLSSHYNFDRLGNEQSSHDLTDAINLALALGIHMRRQHRPVEKKEIEYFTNLWWCCYIFDRFNGLVNSKCTFITQENFNVDLPYNNINLLKLVQLARTLEHMLLSVIQPFNNNNILNNNSSLKRHKLFNADEFQRFEFELCRGEKEMKNIYEGQYSTKEAPFNAYMNDAIHFLTRLVNNTIIIVSQKSNYDNVQIPNTVPEAIATEASRNILRYMLLIKEEVVLNIPLVPWCVALAMAVSLKRKVKYLLKDINEGSLESEKSENENDYEDTYKWEDYITELNKFSSRWWVVEEICDLSISFIQKLEASSTLSRKYKYKYKSNSYDSQNKRLKVLLDYNDRISPFSIPPKNSSDIVGQIANDNNNSSGLLSSHNNSTPEIRNLIQQNETEQKKSDFQSKNYALYDNNQSEFIPHSDTQQESTTTPFMSAPYSDFLESVHIDLFDPEFLHDFPNIVHHFTQG